MKSNIVLRRTVKVPVYDLKVVLMVVRNVRLAVNAIFGKEQDPLPENMNYEGMCLGRGDTIVVLFQDDPIGHGLVAHELFHATHRIMDCRSAVFHLDHQEPFAYVNEFLHTWVYAQFKKAGIRVR